MAFDTNRIESDGLSTIESRLNEILQRWFCGSQSEMARQLGVTQAAISLAVTGKRKLGPRLLTAVKGLPGLPVDWLIGGKGTLPERPVSRDPARCFLPLYRLLRDAFPIAEERHPSSEGRLVSAADYADSRIVLELSSGREWADPKSCKLQPGDCLILETDRNAWAAKPWTLENRYAVIISPDRALSFAELAYVRRVGRSLDSGKETTYVKRLRGGSLDSSRNPREPNARMLASRFFTQHGRNPRAISITSGSQDVQSDLPRPRVRQSELVPVAIEDVVAVAVLRWCSR